MARNKVKTSVIIVNYHADELVAQLKKGLKNTSEIEVIVIDNSSGKSGFGAGCNRGAEQSHGETLLFCNPDITISAKDVLQMHDFLVSHPQVGIVGPQIVNEIGETQITCSAIPTPCMAMIVYSWLGNIWPFSLVWRKYRLENFSHESSRPVPSASGACFMMRRDDYFAIGGCDEQLFLYFEEFDLAKRVQDQLNISVYFLSSITVQHIGEFSTKQATKISTHFRNSRHYWLQKYYGIYGIMADFWIRVWEK